ncbi:hypothetical protein IW140_004523 [Coemansia sp. RSA 1813]|nr:hypothetical protein EV178_004664 [Coemansia sp. RSA 1646]KAJ1771184.1 hypothetical protein LPJ74_002574 [Coemansia sp. RSA 1843]KAJ2087792.1 hypothetical protein IW138_004686 [Coemansia sp. RSA 986]KAJ2212687.1 hypothetical protein EV179_004434 [Coemansia sp. RSA 487]KAJ2567389.1 hypothetical protein IW140_004523 [Coemansia sp. RSA 1813]
MVSMRGSGSAWWYGRAIRLYFIFSITISALWIVKIFYINQPVDLLQQANSREEPRPEHEFNNQKHQQKPTPVMFPAYDGTVDEASMQLAKPSNEYSHAYTDHIYCINEENKMGRKSRMAELLRYMHLQGEIFSKKQAKHIDVWRDMINNGHKRALVVEDDVDFEIDAVAVIGKSIEALNKTNTDWDIIYVGHCSVEENSTGSGKSPVYSGFGRLYRSVHPFCTSGYLLSINGAKKLYAYFSKNTSQKHALDVQLVALIKRNLLKSYSLHPPVVYQRRDLYPSDDGLELKVARLFQNSAWDEAVSFESRLANWSDPLDREYMDPVYKQIPSWMENKNQVS